VATLDLTVDVTAAQKALKNYQKRKLPVATKRAINRAVRGGFTDAKKELKTRITMPVKKIGERIKLTFAKAEASGSLRVIGPRRGKEFSNLGSFKIKIPKKTARGKKRLKGKGIRAKVYGERRLKVYRGAFAWTRPGKTGDAVTVFKRDRSAPKVAPSKRSGVNPDGTTGVRRIKRGPRKGKIILRQPLKPVYGASLIREFVRTNRRGNKAAIDVVRESMRRRFLVEFKRQLELL